MTPRTPAVWCGIPVYNNAGSIFEIARQCRVLIDHVLVIDDGSTDANLVELLKSLDVMVIRHPQNRGKGQALLTAFDYAADHGAEYLITLDGDGQHLPTDIPRFFPHLSPYTILIGYRNEITGDMPRRSRFGREFSDFWIRLEAGGNARDTQSGFRAYPLAAVKQLKLDSHFYNFEMEIITKALWAGLIVGSVPIHVWYPPAQQRVSSFDPLRDNLRISLLHTRLILRQLLPIRHRKIRRRQWQLSELYCENSEPIGLAVSAGLSILMGIVLWPWGVIAAGYVTIRLHLNKMIALISVAVCTLPMVPAACEQVGGVFVKSPGHLRWIVGSHIVAIPSAIAAGWMIYAIAGQRQKRMEPNRT